nr:hypothetical protein [Arsenicicoccus sp. oral taxon 190]
MVLLVDRLLHVPRRPYAVVGEVGEEAVHHLLLEVELEGLLPAHHRPRQHVVEHLGDDRGDAVAPPEPLVDPLLHDRHVGLVLLEQELDGLQAEGHVPGLVRLRREAEGHRRQVAVEGRRRHERHEEQVGQQELEGEPDRDQELEGAGRQGVVEEGLGDGQVPDAVVLLGEVVEARVVLVVVGQRVDLGLAVAHLVDRLAQRGEAGSRPVEVPRQVGQVAVRLVLQRGHAGEEDLHGVEVAGVGQGQVPLPLGEAVEDRVEPLVLLRLVLVVGVDGQAEGVLPLAPVVDRDALVGGVGVELVVVDIARLPVEVAGEGAVARLHRQLLRLGELLSPDLVVEGEVVVGVPQDGVGLADELLGERADRDLAVGPLVDGGRRDGPGGDDGQVHVLVVGVSPHQLGDPEHERCHADTQPCRPSMPKGRSPGRNAPSGRGSVGRPPGAVR